MNSSWQPEFEKFAETPYGRKLRHPKWQRARLEAMQLAGWNCTRCGDTETPLEVHHTTYRAGAEPWEYPLAELRVFCERCHEFEHVPVSGEGCCMGDCGELRNEPPGYERPCSYNEISCFRYHRLAAVLGAMESPTKKRLSRLHDHKGMLTVFWRYRPSPADRQHVERLWSSIGNEDSSVVEHVTGNA